MKLNFNTISHLQKSCKELLCALCPDSHILSIRFLPPLHSLYIIYTYTHIGFFWTNFSSDGTAILDSHQHWVSLSYSSQCNFISNAKDEANIFVSLFQIRNNIRHYFLEPPQLKLLYDVITWIVTQITISYTVVPFVLLSIKPSLTFYR